RGVVPRDKIAGPQLVQSYSRPTGSLLVRHTREFDAELAHHVLGEPRTVEPEGARAPPLVRGADPLLRLSDETIRPVDVPAAHNTPVGARGLRGRVGLRGERGHQKVREGVAGLDRP